MVFAIFISLFFCHGEGGLTKAVLAHSRFLMNTQVVDAVEGGPVTLRVTLTYQGEKPVEINEWFKFPNVYVEAPRTWKFVGGDRLIRFNGSPFGSRTMAKGDKWTEQISVDHDYKPLAGEAKLRVSWVVAEPAQADAGTDRGYREGKTLARLGQTITVNIKPRK